MEILPMGARAVLVGGIADPAGWALGLRAARSDGIVDVVPGAETVLVTCTDAAALAIVRAALGDVQPVADDSAARTAIRIPVRYDGPDLDSVAATARVTVDAVIELHSGAPYVAAFCGFSPGFAYLTGLPERLRQPRRASPRTRVPAGSVAIASEYSAVYPRSTPGGWHLLGTTDAVLFDPHAGQPALIRPGDHVRFVPC